MPWRCVSEIPKFKPAFKEFYIVENCLYVLKKKIAGIYFFDVFDGDGTFIEDVNLDFLPLVNRNGCVYTIDPKFEGGVEEGYINAKEVVRYKILK